MDKGAAIDIVSRFVEALLAGGIRPRKVILYGSYANGTNREGSDIDLVVISEDFAGKDYWKRIDILTDAVYAVFAPVAAVAMTPEEWDSGESFIVDFARNGEVLYAA